MNPQPAPASAPAAATEPEARASILDAILARPPELRPPLPLVGECVADRHQTLLGRYLVRYPGADGQPTERWLPSLHGLPVRAHDRVLLVFPANWPEPIVTGVIDGFAVRPEPPATVAAALELRPDEVVRVVGARGEPLVEVRQNESGPVVRLMTEDVQLEVPGKLKFAAKSIEMQATLGAVNIAATDDVNVTGETINLN